MARTSPILGAPAPRRPWSFSSFSARSLSNMRVVLRCMSRISARSSVYARLFLLIVGCVFVVYGLAVLLIPTPSVYDSVWRTLVEELVCGTSDDVVSDDSVASCLEMWRDNSSNATILGEEPKKTLGLDMPRPVRIASVYGQHAGSAFICLGSILVLSVFMFKRSAHCHTCLRTVDICFTCALFVCMLVLPAFAVGITLILPGADPSYNGGFVIPGLPSSGLSSTSAGASQSGRFNLSRMLATEQELSSLNLSESIQVSLLGL
jgi:hypothetical protein